MDSWSDGEICVEEEVFHLAFLAVIILASQSVNVRWKENANVRLCAAQPRGGVVVVGGQIPFVMKRAALAFR